MATISASLHEGLQVDITAGEHQWRADEPEGAGGTGTGPNPYELLLGSLAACTCVTVALYCRRKGWALTSVSARFEHDRVHADDCDECDDDASGYLDRVTSHVRIDGDFDDQQRRRLEQVAARCPVHKTLEKGVVLRDEVTVG